MSSLLPSNRTPLETELALAALPLDAIDPEQIEWIWDAWRCPGPLLPWLAWGLSVDIWSDDWDEIRKRQAIADSPYYHRIKGTRLAVEMALALAERPYEITEWFERIPEGRRGTFTAIIEAPLGAIADIRTHILPLVMRAKPKSRKVFFGVGEVIHGDIIMAGGVLEDSLTTVEPYAYAGEEVSGGLIVGAGLLHEELTTIEVYG